MVHSNSKRWPHLTKCGADIAEVRVARYDSNVTCPECAALAVKAPKWTRNASPFKSYDEAAA